METWISKFNPGYKTALNMNSIVFSFTDEEKLVGYQLNMLKNNRIPCFLSCEVLNVDGGVKLNFDITSLISLNKVLERRSIGRSDFIEILQQITNLFQTMENYLLDFGGILLISRYIYCSPDYNRLYFIFIPDKEMPESVIEPIRKLLLELVVKEIKFKDELSDNYIQKLIEVLKSADFGIESLISYLRNLNKQSEPEAEKKPEPAAVSPQKPDITIKKDIHEPLPSKIPSVKHHSYTDKVMAYPLKSYLILGAELLCLLMLFLTLLLNGSFNPDNPNMATSIAGLLLIGGALTYLVCSKVFKKELKVEKIISKNISIPPGPAIAKKSGSDVMPSVQPVYVNSNIRRPVLQCDEIKDRHISTAVLAQSTEKIPDKTVLLSEKNMGEPALSRLGSQAETISVNKLPFMIGRLKEQTDYCLMNSAVGKLHAEIAKKGESFYITDMNTRNGTFINGIRVEGSREYLIKNGDKIMLANEEFIFSA